MLRPDLCVVAKELYWGQGRRPKPEDHFALELFASFARHADLMFDIGAYTGIFTLVGTRVNSRLKAHAFEIAPDVHQALIENCVRNAVVDRVTLHHAGVGDPDFHMTVPVESIGSALPDFYSSRLHFGSGVSVPFTSLDSLSALVPARSRVVVKIDVEGTENAVFRFGQEFLTSFRPHILCEVLHGVAKAEDIEALLEPHGYRFYLVREADILPAARLKPESGFRDWLFTTLGPDDLAARGISLAGDV